MDSYANKRVFIVGDEFTCEIPKLNFTICFLESKSNFEILINAEGDKINHQ
jgi:hypothetical protein